MVSVVHTGMSVRVPKSCLSSLLFSQYTQTLQKSIQKGKQAKIHQRLVLDHSLVLSCGEKVKQGTTLR